MNTPKHLFHSPVPAASDRAARQFYRRGLRLLQDAGQRFLVGGAYALRSYTGISRETKDFDIFVHPRDRDRVVEILAAGDFKTDHTFPHWLSKAIFGEHFIDIVFSSGNGLCPVDDEWFDHAVEREVLGMTVMLAPTEEMLWSKAFIQERERYDGADIAHILRACAATLAWPRLMRRFDEHWRVLLGHLVLFGFIYPAERDRIPEWVMQDLLYRVKRELAAEPPSERVCRGTLVSREQYLTDVMEWGYEDARLLPRGRMTKEDIAHWTASIEEHG
jgi:hypothetical protein